MSERDDFEKWISHGINQGWISEIFCGAHITDHTTLPRTSDGCIPVVHIFAKELVK